MIAAIANLTRTFFSTGRTKLTVVVAALALIAGQTLAVGPVPIGPSTTTISYTTSKDEVHYSEDRAFTGVTPSDATPLADAPNIRTFNAVNTFGRRTLLASNPMFAEVLGPNESLLAHSFFKIDIRDEFFPDLDAPKDLTITVEGIEFSEPVTVIPSTFLFHCLWDGEQSGGVGGVDPPYHHIHNQHTQTDPFRDLHEFIHGGVFADHPSVDFVLADVSPVFSGLGTSTIGFSLTVPYEMLKSLEHTAATFVPDDLPAPQGFLEPFHFHVEYVVIPEPASLCLLLSAALFLRGVARRRRALQELSNEGALTL